MIEMAMGHDDRCGSGILSEAFLSGLGNESGRAHDAGIDENPAAIARAGSAEENDVDDPQSSIGEIVRNLACTIISRIVALRVVGTLSGVERNLLRHRALLHLIASPFRFLPFVSSGPLLKNEGRNGSFEA